MLFSPLKPLTRMRLLYSALVALLLVVPVLATAEIPVTTAVLPGIVCSAETRASTCASLRAVRPRNLPAGG
jgi:hypothetical protein